MSFCVKKIVQFPRGGLEYIPQNDNGTINNNLYLLGGVFRDTRYAWQSKGPNLEVRNTKTGSKVGAWVFGGILKDSNTRITAIKEIPRPNGRMSLLAVAIDCTISGGIICIFDVFTSKVIRAILLKEKISCLHVIDPGIEDLNLPGPLRNFDGILAVGTEGGKVILIDICRQICEESSHTISKRDELNPSELVILTPKQIARIEHFKEISVRDGNHLGIHVNAIFNRKTEHFVLKGPKDDDRIHVNKEEVVTSAIYYCPQLASLLVGYNFGAFQLWDLTTLKLVYTSPVCDDHFPITNFALQEPTDDPRAFCYIWVAYGNTEIYQNGLPFAVMYSLCYDSKEYHEGYGYLYQDFNYCTIRFQVELGQLEENRGENSPKGGFCMGFQPITKLSTSKESYSHLPAGDTLALCLISWTIWYSKSNTQTCCLVFDLNQWYKEQMPSFTKWQDATNYIWRANLSELIHLNGHKGVHISNVLMETKSLSQFIGVHRLEEHFYPTSLSFSLWILRETDVMLTHNQGVQKYLLSQIETAGPLCLIRPTDMCKQAITLGLTPLFVDVHPNKSLSTEMQREILLNVALEHQLIGWLCKCASEWANGSFSSAGCSMGFMITWAFERAVVLKNNCDTFCAPLFDYSQSRLDGNTSILLNSCTRQLNSLCVLYKHIINKLWSYVSCLSLVKEHFTCLEMVSVYFEVLQWLVNVGLLPECHPSTYPRPDNSERISAPYPVQELNDYYHEKRAKIRLLSKKAFETNESLLFIDHLIDRKCGGVKLQKLWQEDGGSGLYPPPSLQSLIRTYLVEGAGISQKHSLVIYLFLDLAMALDQSRYSSVVTHLIKFPAVFKVSPSIIKITQAFWQLDHGDFTTAMEQLLDPFVLNEDLQSWHHMIAMRTLLLNKQSNFALLYMQIRKPPIIEEKDVFTAISLFIANNMLDEAFYFKKQHQNNNEEKLLAHLFHECSKNDALHLVLYKCLNSDEERAFFKYLKSVENPTSDDLQIFYYLLRSRFIEAFDTHSNIKKKCPERQGLIGQSMATKTDQIVKLFKTLLPDVNKNLVDYVRRERVDLWKEVKRPTPMSVFVHNTNEQVKYKSTLIHAALAKAKHTFSDGINQRPNKNIITEETPFLRTPTVCKNGKRILTPVITSKIINTDESDDDSCTPPNKKMKISPRMSTTATYQSHHKNTAQSLTLTPIVKRKTSMQHDHSLTHGNLNVCTPQSILKVRQLVQLRDSITDDTFQDDINDNQICEDASLQSTSLGLQPRGSLSRTPKRQHVQFDAATRFSSSLSEQSTRVLDNTPSEDQNIHKSSLSSKDISSMISSSTNEDISDDVFYSPEISDNLTDDKVAKETKIEESISRDVEVSKNDKENLKDNIKTNKTEVEPTEKTGSLDKNLKSVIDVKMDSPRARKSYKRSFGEMSPVRSSSRLSKLQSAKKEESNSPNLSQRSNSVIVENKSFDNSMSNDSLSPKLTIPKLKGRKSLSRQVLENNTFSKMHTPPSNKNITSSERSYLKSEIISISEKSCNESKITTIETNLKITDTEEKDNSLQTPSSMHKVNTSSSSVTTKKILENTLDTDTSVDSDVSFHYGDQEDSDMQLSDSFQEYIDFLIASGKKLRRSEPLTNNEKIPKVQLSFDEDNVDESADNQEISCDLETVNKDNKIIVGENVSLNNEEKTEDNKTTLNLEELVETNEQSMNVEERPERDPEEVLTELNPVVIYEPSSEEKEKLRNTSSIPTEEMQIDVYDGLSNEGSYKNDQEFSCNELEVNIFEVVDDTAFINTKKNPTFADNPTTDSYYIPDSEMAFLKSTSDESIVIISSSDDEENSDLLDNNSDFSKTTEEFVRHDSSSRNTVSSSDDSKDDQIVFNYEEQEVEENFTEDQVNYNKKTDAIVNVDLEENFESITSNETEAAQFTELSEQPSTEESLGNETGTDTEIKTINEEIMVTTNKEKDTVKISNESLKLPSVCNVISNQQLVEILSTVEKSKESIPELMEVVEPSPLLDNAVETVDSTTNQKDATTVIETAEVSKELTAEIQSTDQEISSATLEKDIELKIDSSESNQLNNKEKIITKKRLLKVDQSTNTSISIKGKELGRKKTDDQKPIQQNTRRKKAFGDDQTTSSSDNTEGDMIIHETVVVEVHTPSTTNKKNAIKKERKKSTLEEVAGIDIKNVSDVQKHKYLIVEIGKNDDIFKDKCNSSVGAKRVLGKRTRSSISEVSTPTPAINEGEVDDIKIDCDLDTSTKIIDDTAMVKLTLRKKRSASVDAVKTFSRKRITKRNKSVDEVVKEDVSANKAKSVIHMPVISEENKEQDRLEERKKTRSVADSYATARRLTRRQASLVKEITVNSDAESLDDGIKKQIDLEPIDPINLLDKEPFEGKPDPEEKNVYAPSSPSTSTTSAQKTMRSRSNSVLSDVSISPPQNLPETPKKRGLLNRSPAALGVATRSRRRSDASSVVSEHSQSSTPKGTRRKKLSENLESTVRSTRSRSASISSVKSGESTSKKGTRARKQVSAKTGLPEILEEKSAENVDNSSTSSKKSKSGEKNRRKK